MYHQYFGLREAPFSIAVNPRYLFMSQRHRDALAHLLYGVGAGGGFILLTGEVGTGKTTINRCLLEQLPDTTDTAIILNPALDALELLATVCDELGIAPAEEGAAPTLKSMTDRLHRFLLENHAQGRRTVLLIDEAQHLDFAVLEQIRLLTNLETSTEKLLTIILIGQPELADMLRRPELRQLNQRISARYDLGPLNVDETGAYIRHRLAVAGQAPGTELFPPRLIRAVHRRSRGIPRLINLLCDRMLLGAYGRGSTRLDPGLLRRAAREVTGEGLSSGRWWPAAAVLPTVALAAFGAWLWLRPEQPPVAPPSAEAAPAASAPAPVASSAPVPGSVVPETADAQADDAAAQVRPSWLLAPAPALNALWRLLTDAPPPADPCVPGPAAALRCSAAAGGTWQDLRALGSPLVLDLVTSERFAAAALVLRIDEESALVATADRVVPVPLVRLAALWDGRYRYLWPAPPGFTSVLGPGDRGPAVAYIASLFARIDGQPKALSDGPFSPALVQRVQLFQREHGLVADGLVGEQTLQVLGRAAGLVPDMAQMAARIDELRSLGDWL